MLGNEKQNPLNLYPSNVALPNQRTVEYRDLSWLCFQCIYSLFGQHQGSFFNVQFAGGLEREFQNWSKLETILCWFQFTCWFETNSHSVSFLVCQLVWVGLWDGGVRCAVVQLGGASWKCAVVQLGVPVEREFSQLRRNERAAGQPPAFDRGTQPHRPSKKIKNKKKQPHRPTKKNTQPHRHSHLTNPFKCTPTVIDTLKNVKAIVRTQKTRKQAVFHLPYF